MKIRVIYLLILISLFVPNSVIAKQIVCEKEGFGAPNSKNASLEIRKQEAFVAAFFAGLNELTEFMYGSSIKSITQVKTGKTKIFSSVHEKISEFDVDSQTITFDWSLEAYLISVDYKNQKYIVKEFKLISPPIEFVDFPKWSNPPKTISGINIKGLKYVWDNLEKDWVCVVKLSYIYDTDQNIKEIKKNIEIKNLDFEFQKDKSNNYVFETVVINGSAFGGGSDSPDTIRKKALDDALRNGVEKVNGVFIQSLTEVENAQLSKDQIITQTLGIANVTSKKYEPRFNSEGNFEIVCTVTAKVPIVRIVGK